MKKWTLLALTLLFYISVAAQGLNQSIRGTVIDEDTKVPLIGAHVTVLNSTSNQGIVTDHQGKFKLSNLLLGRLSIKISYIGYKEKYINDIVLNSAKEVLLDVGLEESAFTAENIVITAVQNHVDPFNDMSIVSSRSITTEQTSRYAGAFNDPSRVTSSFAGVTNTQDGGNDIIVRGNSPKYIQWRLEGIPISNPNHFADQNAVSGMLSALNINLLSTSDFHTGAFSADFGNALSGVYDVRMRKGNYEKFEGNASIGLLGIDLTLEGPISKNSSSSYLVNYRYSTIGLVSDLGLVDFDALLNYQDASFKIWMPTQKMGSFTLFGIAGKSAFHFKDVDPSIWVTPSDNFMREDITEDYDKGSHLLNIGIVHSIPTSKHAYLKTSLLYSNEGIMDEIFENMSSPTEEINRQLNFNTDLDKSVFRLNSIYNHKVNSRCKVRLGANYNLFKYKVDQSRLSQENERIPTLNFEESIPQLGTFLNIKYEISEPVTIMTGMHSNNVLYNNKYTIEPRIALKYQLTHKSRISVAYGNHSTMESIPNYFTTIQNEDGSFKTPNTELDLLRAHHYLLGYTRKLSTSLQVKIEGYYQNLYNIPVANNQSSTYSTINEGLEFQYVDLVNKGTGKNYGVELTLERRLTNGFYYLLNGTFYRSKYTALDKVERNTQYDGRFLSNLLIGKEFEGLGKNKNSVFSINARAFCGGAKSTTPLLRVSGSENELAVDPSIGLYYDERNSYSQRLDNTYSLVLNLAYTWNKTSTTHEINLSFDNITNSQARLSEYYDASEPNGIGYQKQVGFFPNLMYRLYF